MLYTGLNLPLNIYLGVSKEERKQLQSVDVVFEFQNIITQHCMNDDNANDYVCYQTIAKAIYKKFNTQEVRLLEYMCYQIYKIIKSIVAKDVLINVSVQKQCTNIVDGYNAQANCRYIEFVGKV